MVSLWPWKRDASSTASFEKTLSTLSTRITDTQSRLDAVRRSSRRVKVLWTLYLSFAWLIYTIVLLLVVGHRKMGPYEWTPMAGGPLLIYVLRTLLGAYYTFRINSLSKRLKDQQEERAKTIRKLKEATKYDSTMELIEKYGGGTSTEGTGMGGDSSSAAAKVGKKINKGDGFRAAGDARKRTGHAGPGNATVTPTRRTTMPPPPTANIQRRDELDAPPRTPQSPSSLLEPTAEFAPNADFQHFASSSSHPVPMSANPSMETEPSHRWYDRIFDALLGEDETAPKNRIALICRQCRLVNGQAPPGTQSLVEVGRWRCMACGSMNGEEKQTVGERLVREVLAEKEKEDATAAAEDDNEEEEGEEEVGLSNGSTDRIKENQAADGHERSEAENESSKPVDDSPASAVRRRRGRKAKG